VRAKRVKCARRGVWAAGFLALAACGQAAPRAEAPPRPVVTIPLSRMAPSPPLAVTGVAEPYREAEVSFEVSGRITRLLDVGRTVEVTTMLKEGAEDDGGPDVLEHVGEVLAEIDKTSYRQRLQAAQLRLATARAGLEAQKLDLEQVAPKTVARAQAQRDSAETQIASARASVQSAESSRATTAADLARSVQLLRDKQISKAEFDQVQNAHDTAVANLAKAEAGLRSAEQQLEGYEASLAEAKASLDLKAANVGQTQAQIAEIAVSVAQAETDLERCTLRAPFGGRITAIHASQGDFVAAGRPVLRLTLIDPMKVSVTVSADRERLILPGSHARVRPKEFADFDTQYEELFGTVFEKGAVADPATRTFRIEVMVRNARRRVAGDAEQGLTRIGFREILPAVERRFGEGGPLFVCRECCLHEGQKHALYRLKGGKFAQPRPARLFEGRLDLERVEVLPHADGPADFMQILNWSFQRVEAAPGFTLENGDLFVNFDRDDLTAASIEQGAVFDRFEWAIRPGDLVPVTFDVERRPEGFWVPDDAIRVQGEQRSVFAVEDGKAREIPVSVHESSGRLRRIEGAGLEVGRRLVVLGVHYVFDGADVTVAREGNLDTYTGQAR